MWQGQLGLPIRQSGLVLLNLRRASDRPVARWRRSANGERINWHGKLHRAWLHAEHWTTILWKDVVVSLGVWPCYDKGTGAILGQDKQCWVDVGVQTTDVIVRRRKRKR